MNDDEFDELLDNWQPGFRPDPELEVQVRHRLRNTRLLDERPKRQNPLVRFIASPMQAALGAAALIAFGIFIAHTLQSWFAPSDQYLLAQYRSAIDPIYRLSSGSQIDQRSASPSNRSQQDLDKTLAWLEEQLQLEKSQHEHFTTLHASYCASLDMLYAELLSLREGYNQMDRERIDNNVVDFLALYQLLNDQEALRTRSIQLTEELLQKAFEVLDDDQRQRFDRLVLEKRPDSALTHRTTTNA